MFSLNRFYYLLALLILILLIGTAGYHWIDDYNWIDALFMTIITISTVGYEEVKPLSDDGKLFTIFLIIFSFGIFTYAISQLTLLVLNNEWKKILLYTRTIAKIKKMKDHVIICGFGRNGRQALRELLKRELNVVIIENKPIDDEFIREFARYKSVVFIEGNATSEAVLEKAGVKTAGAIITTLPNDADNLYVVITARYLNPQVQIISRASEDNSFEILIKAGANNVIMPDKIGGAHMANLVARPALIEFFDYLSGNLQKDVYIEEVNLDRINPDIIGKTIEELNIRTLTGVNLIGYKDKNGFMHLNPPPGLILEENMKFYVLGNKEQIEKFEKIIKE
ncbi:MAG: potassium transporter TrkA [Vicingaceae bacterium]|nr:MAG: potassium transporter TrkA [Vicingaceae bacterium]